MTTSRSFRDTPPRPQGVVREFWGLLCQNKKWWLAPLLLVLLLIGVLTLAASTAIAPFIYTLF